MWRYILSIKILTKVSGLSFILLCRNARSAKNPDKNLAKNPDSKK